MGLINTFFDIFTGMKSHYYSFLILVVLWPLNGCKNAPASPINPNGDSELALLMRAMYEDGVAMKKRISSGGTPYPSLDYNALLTAEATEPDKVATDEYRQMAASYIQIMNDMQKSDHSTAKKHYDSMVESCMNCHKAMCPGPMVKIEKLYLNLQ